MTWDAFLADFWATASPEIKSSTKNRYQRVLSHFQEDCRPDLVSDIDHAMVNDFRQKALSRPRGKRTLTKASVNFEMKVIRRVMNHAVKMGLVEKNPCSGFKRLKETDGLSQIVVLEAQEIEAFKERCSPEFLPYFLLLVRTGMRKGEADLLTRTDYLREERRLRITNAKTATSAQDLYRYFPLSNRLMNMLDRRAAQVRGQKLYPIRSCNWLIANLRRTARSLAEDGLLIPSKANLRIHDLRHTFASQFLANGGDLRTLMALLGHYRLQTTERYLHVVGNRLAAAADTIPF